LGVERARDEWCGGGGRRTHLPEDVAGRIADAAKDAARLVPALVRAVGAEDEEEGLRVGGVV
jgi:hypothetical protein